MVCVANVNKGLTSFRALAFFSIFMFHMNVCGSHELGINGGYLGVQAFFVLSGFLLTPILVKMKANLNSKDFFVHFYGRRALRIFPLYYSYLAIVACVYLFSKYSPYAHLSFLNDIALISELNRFIYSLPWTSTYTYDFYHATEHYYGSNFDTHFWSLAIEEQFYLLWPLAIFLVSAKFLKGFLWLIILLGPILRISLMLMISSKMLTFHQPADLVIYVLPFSYIDAFAIGGYFSIYEKSKPSYVVWSSIMAALILGLVTTWLSAGHIQWDQLGYGPYMNDSYKYIWGYSVLNLMFSYVLVNLRDRAFLPALFENPVLVYLGTISYGMYLFHLPVLGVVYIKMHNFPEIVRAATTLLITIAISIVSYELMEKRFINLKDRYFVKAVASK